MIKQHLESKTMVGLLILLAAGIGLSLAGKLTPESVEVIKYVGSSFMAVRVAANVGESFGKKD